MTTTDQQAEWFSYWFNTVLDNIELVLKGKRNEVATSLIAMFAEGHLLLEDVPGTGKTTLAKSIAHSLGADWQRIQFTPDLLPSDVTGGVVYDQSTSTFEFRPGPVFASIVLADEINRASPKTQAALLEVMEERQVTIDSTTHPAPRPFVVIGTQNPVEQEGTYRLPEAQLDRFLLRTSIGYPDLDAEIDAVRSVSRGMTPEQLQPVIEATDIARMVGVANGVHVDDAIIGYAVRLGVASRSLPELRLGVSTRGALSLIKASRALAVTQGRSFVIVDDIKAIAPTALSHRMLLTPESELRGVSTGDLVEQLLTQVDAPRTVRN
ncbi:MAG: AAA family ATPase [Ilumatobacter sp.]